MSFVAFPANYPGTPPYPFRPFPAGEMVFYLVGTLSPDSALPNPGQQLSVDTETSESPVCGRRYGRRRCSKAPGHSGRHGRGEVTVTVTETAKGWRGRRRVDVASRTYSWSKYTRGAKAAAREAAVWTSVDGSPLTVWSNLVSVPDAAELGYRTPGGVINARPGMRGVGVENNAQGGLRGRNVVPVGPAAVDSPPVDSPVPAEPVEDQIRRSLPAWAQAEARDPEAVAERAAARMARAERIAARNRQGADRANREPDQIVPDPERGAARFAALDLDTRTPAEPLPESTGEDRGAARFASLDLD
jgi:hypothetical protein